MESYAQHMLQTVADGFWVLFAAGSAMTVCMREMPERRRAHAPRLNAGFRLP